MPKPVRSNPFAGFAKANADVRQRLIGLSVGEVGSRKTSFWLEAPAPVAVQSLDFGMEGVVERYQKKKDIYVKEYDWQPPYVQGTTDEEISDMAQALWAAAKEKANEFEADFEKLVKNARSIVWDKETDVWGLFRYAEHGPDMNAAPRDYPKLNQRYRRLINMTKATDVNFGCIEGMKDEWGAKVNKRTGAQGAASTGKRIRAGFGELDGLVHLCLTHTGVNKDTWGIEVGKARGPGGHAIAGQEYPMLTFPEFATLVFPDSCEEDWV